MDSQTARDLKTELAKHASDYDALFLQRFFKTGPGQYGEGDVFIGVRVPQTRKVCKEFKDLPLAEIDKLINSPVHEHRLAALIIATIQFKKADENEKKKLYEFYLSALKRGRINNWDLIDLSCDPIMGQYLMEKPKDILYTLTKSEMLWERRASIMATFAFIKAGKSDETIRIAKMLLHDKEDLIHKAVGWMLREVGKRADEQALLNFLDEHAHEMPRTMLRYAIERLSAEKRLFYMTKDK